MSELPPGWEFSTIGEVTTPVSKINPRDTPDLPLDYIDIGGIDGDRGVIAETQGLRGVEAPSRARQLVRAGDTVLSTVRTYMRKSALVPEHLDGQVASTGFSVLRPVHGITPRFLYHAVRRREFVDALSALQTGSNYPAVRDRDVRSMAIPIAPTAEQERVVAAIDEHLSRLDAAEAAIRSSRLKLDTLRKATISSVLERHAWPMVKWGDVGQTLSGRTFPSASYGDEGIRLLRPGNLGKSGHVNWSSKATTHLPERFAAESPKFVLSGRHLLMNLTAQSLADDFLGRVCLSDDSDHFLLNQRIAKLSSTSASDEYLFWVFRSWSFRKYVAGLNTGSLIQHISTKQLASFGFPLPPPRDQIRLVDEIEVAVETVDRVELFLDQLASRSSRLRRFTVAAAFLGLLVPQDPADEPASVLLERMRTERAAPTRRRQKVTSS
ncbi:MAG: hypothetical protein WD598_11590 [Acidimicrobiia bacterium]